MKQHILTIPVGQVLECLANARQRGERIISVCPHFKEGFFSVDSYIVITEDGEAD